MKGKRKEGKEKDMKKKLSNILGFSVCARIEPVIPTILGLEAPTTALPPPPSHHYAMIKQIIHYLRIVTVGQMGIKLVVVLILKCIEYHITCCTPGSNKGKFYFKNKQQENS